MRIFALAATLYCWFSCAAPAETRTALVVGIGHYNEEHKALPPAGPPRYKRIPPLGQPGTRTVYDLPGAVSDAEAMSELLTKAYGFHVDSLIDQAATADAILSWLSEHLDKEHSGPGDVVLFYFAGHGAEIRNPATADGFDQTLVTADYWRGTPDIRDKELARLFLPATERHVVLRMIADSCHSGSIARDPFATPLGTLRPRLAPNDTRTVSDHGPGDSAENHGLLVLSAANRDQLANPNDEGTHGLFTGALLQVLSATPHERLDRVMEQVRALMRQQRTDQDPNLEGLVGRDRDLTGLKAVTSEGTVIYAESGGSKRITLRGGLALGLRPDCVLRATGTKPGEPGIRLRVTGDVSLNTAEADVISAESGSNASSSAGDLVRPGDSFVVETWARDSASLRVYISPATMDRATLETAARRFVGLKNLPTVRLLEDPWTERPEYYLRWNGQAWLLIPSSLKLTTKVLGASPAPSEVAAAMQAGRHSLFVEMPPYPELKAALPFGAAGDDSIVVPVESADRATYILIGHSEHDGAIRYAWALRGLVDSEWRRRMIPLPLFAPFTDSPALLRDKALDLAKIRGWLALQAPAGHNDFPYSLVLRNEDTKALVTGDRIEAGKSYRMLLKGNEQIARYSDLLDITPQYVYVFAITSGKRVLLFPPSKGDNELNLLPRAQPGQSAPVDEIALLYEGAPFDLRLPDNEMMTLVLLTSKTPVADPALLGDPAMAARGGNPLTRLLNRVDTGARDVKDETPADWWVERLVVATVDYGVSSSRSARP